MERFKVEDIYFWKMEPYIKDNLKMKNLKEEELIITIIILSIMDSGKMVRSTEKVLFISIMEINM